MIEKRANNLDAKSRLQNRILYGLAAMSLVIGLSTTVWGQDGLLRLMELHRNRVGIGAENHRLLMENLELIQKVKSLGKTGAIEQAARNELGYTRPDEVVFVISE